MKKPSTTLVVGATGATGQLFVEQLLDRGEAVKAIVRSPSKLPERLLAHELLSVIEGNVLDFSDDELVKHVDGCTAVVSCLGHNLSFRGIFGPPYQLVAESARRICQAAEASHAGPSKFVLMSTTGVRNRDLSETISFGQHCVIGLLRLLLPPHADNEQAAHYLRTRQSKNQEAIEWVAVRPDGLIDQQAISPYELHPSPTRSAIFDSGQTSRINVAHFMAELIIQKPLWNEWKGQMPVIYNKPVD